MNIPKSLDDVTKKQKAIIVGELIATFFAVLIIGFIEGIITIILLNLFALMCICGYVVFSETMEGN